MIHFLRSAWDNFRGSGAAALSVPSMDGAFRPNQALEEAPLALRWPTPDNLAVAGGAVHLSSGGQVLRLTGPETAELVQDGPAPVTALAGLPDGTLAVARSGGGVTLLGGPRSGSRIAPVAGMGDVTAMTFTASGALAMACGSARHAAGQWKHDLMSRGATGSVWLCPPGGAPRRIAEGLRYAWGIAEANDGFLVSESWASRLVLVAEGKAAQPVLTNLPGYPAGIAAASDGGFWFSLAAPRNQLVELVLREPGFCAEMMATVEPDLWIAPMLRPSDQPRDPMLKGVQRVSGSEPKPWGSSLSCGFVGHLGADFLPDFSWHSRANGRRHGVTSVIEHQGNLLAASHCGFVASIPARQQ